MKGDWISAVDHDAGTVTICDGPRPETFALQYAAEGTWCWTCDAGGYVIPFSDSIEDQLILDAVSDCETRRIPWVEVPARLKRIVDCGNRKARRAERASRRRELWAAHKRSEKT
jgi:hypothetical protein